MLFQVGKDAGKKGGQVIFPSGGREVLPGVMQLAKERFSITDSRLGNPIIGLSDKFYYLIYPRNADVPEYVLTAIGPSWSMAEGAVINKAISLLERHFGKNDPAVLQVNESGKLIPRLYEIGIGTPQNAYLKGGAFVVSADPKLNRKIILPRHQMSNFVELLFTLAEEGFHAQDKQIDIDRKTLPANERVRRAELRALGRREELYNKINQGTVPGEWKIGLELERRQIERGKIQFGTR